MRLVGIRHVVHDHVLIRLRCSAEGCGREVTISNREKERRRYTDLPASIKQKSFSPYILMLALFSLAAACRTAHQQGMWELQLSRTMSKSTASSAALRPPDGAPHASSLVRPPPPALRLSHRLLTRSTHCVRDSDCVVCERMGGHAIQNYNSKLITTAAHLPHAQNGDWEKVSPARE